MSTFEDQAALDRAAADMAVRDDLARDVVRAVQAAPGYPTVVPYDRYSALGRALDRLVAAHGVEA